MKTQVNLEEATMKAFPLPVVLVTCSDGMGKPNIITITYVTGVNEDPPMVGIAMRPQKYSNRLIRHSGEFVINVPTKDLLKEIDYCGTHSGRDADKFAETGMTTEKSAKLNAPSIKECPINMECRLVKVVNLPSHDLFIGEIVAMNVDEEFLNKGMPDFSRIRFLLTTFLDYREIGEKVGTAFKENKKLFIGHR